MKLRRSLLLTGAPLAAGLSLATTALASGSAPPVTVRVEGARSTLLATRTVTAPSGGAITKGRTPRGACPADSAAGALSRATHGRWNGTYYKGLGIDVTTILGRRLNPRRAYWEFFVNDRVASKGICQTTLRRGDSLLFAAVATKGRAELPIVVRAPRRVRIGRPFVVRAFVYPGSGDATRPVVGARAHWSTAGSRLRITAFPVRRRGELRFTLHGAGSSRATLVLSAKGEIRSAATPIRVVG
jgi:hypothetical protein